MTAISGSKSPTDHELEAQAREVVHAVQVRVLRDADHASPDEVKHLCYALGSATDSLVALRFHRPERAA